MTEGSSGSECRSELADDLFALVSGRLPGDRMEALHSHLAGCPECRARLATLSWIRDQVAEHGGMVFDGHPSAEELVGYEERGGGTDPERLRILERHVAVCEACTEDLRILTEVGKDLASGAPGSSPGVARPSPGRPAGLRRALGLDRGAPVWAYAVIALLLIPMVLTLGPRLVGRPGGAREGIRAVPAVQHLSPGAVRGAEEARVVHLPETGDLALGLEVPVSEAPGARYDGRLEDVAGRRLWQERDLHPVDRFGTMVLVVPRESLSPGRYEIIIRERGTSNPQEFRFPFTLERPVP